VFTQSVRGLSFGKAAWGAAFGALLIALALAVPASGAWVGVTALSSPTVPVETPPDSAIDADGDSYHVWINKNEQVEARIRSTTGRLGPTLKISQGSTLAPPPADEATVGVNSRGDALFAWVSLNSTGTQYQILCRPRTAAGTLGRVQTCLTQSKDLGAIVDPQVALDSDGDAVIAWLQDGATSQLMMKTRTAAGRLGPPKTVAGSATTEIADYQVAMDNAGETVFVYQQNTATVDGQIYAREYSATGTAGRAKPLASPDADEPELALNPRGDAAFTWIRKDTLTGKFLVEGRTMSDAGVLTRTDKLSAVGEVSAPQVDIANDGKSAFAWRNKDLTAGKFRIEGRTRSATGVLGRVQSLSSSTQDAFDPQLGVDGDGDSLFVWREKDPTTGKPVIQSRTITAAGALRPAVRVAGLDTEPYDLQLVVAGNGDAAAVWRNTGLKRVEAAYGP
jgi:hypothetical protein